METRGHRRTLTTDNATVRALIREREELAQRHMREALRRAAVDLIRGNPTMPMAVAVVLMQGNSDFDGALDLTLGQLLEGTFGDGITLREALRKALAGEVSGETTLADLIAH